MKRFSAIFITVLLLFPLVATATEQPIENILVPAADVINDNFVRVGQSIEVNGDIRGDLVVAGQSVVVNGPVAGDVLAAAQTIHLRGPVGGNVRVAGGTVVLDAPVAKNATIAANTIELTENAQVGWSLQAFGSTIDLGGTVTGNTNYYGASATVRGTIKGNARFVLGEEGVLRLAQTAVVEKDLNYHTNQQLVSDPGATVNGTVRMIRPVPGEKQFRYFAASLVSFWRLVSLFGVLVVGLVLLSIAPKTAVRIATRMRERPWHSVGWGILLLVAVPIIAVILLVTIIGIPLAVIGFVLYGIVLYLTKVFASLFLGVVLFGWIRKGKATPPLWSFIVGAVVFSILTMIPLFGWVFEFVGVIWALGAMMLVKREAFLSVERSA